MLPRFWDRSGCIPKLYPWAAKGFLTDVEASTMHIPVIVAAAGGSSRCPGNKLLAPYHGKPLLQWLLQSLSSHPALGRILVVTGAQRTEVEALLFPYPQTRAVFNPHWRAGLASSLRRGVEALPPTRGFLVAMGDTPFFSALTLHRLRGCPRRCGISGPRPSLGSFDVEG